MYTPVMHRQSASTARFTAIVRDGDDTPVEIETNLTAMQAEALKQRFSMTRVGTGDLWIGQTTAERPALN